MARITEQLERTVTSQPGFISSSVHRSRDGRHVVNDVQWATQESLDAAHARPEFAAQMETDRDYVIEAGPILYGIGELREV